MPKIVTYDVYDKGKCILSNVTIAEVRKATGFHQSITKYIQRGQVFKKRYTFEYALKERPLTDFEKEWFKVVAMFKNVVWVTEGGKKLKVSKA